MIFSLLIFVALGLIYQNLSTPKFKDLDPSWGLGRKVTRSVSNDKDYEWYVDQYSTGRNAELNCGPTVIEMVSKWQNENTLITTEYIVDKYIPDEKNYLGVTQYTLYNWLKENNINVTSISEITEEALTRELDNGHLLIAALDMRDIKYNPNSEERVGEYFDFSTVAGSAYHYIIIKGYKEVDRKMYFEAYDPASVTQTYNNGQLIGKDRYYESDELIKAMCKYKELVSTYTNWSDVIVIPEEK